MRGVSQRAKVQNVAFCVFFFVDVVKSTIRRSRKTKIKRQQMGNDERRIRVYIGEELTTIEAAAAATQTDADRPADQRGRQAGRKASRTRGVANLPITVFEDGTKAVVKANVERKEAGKRARKIETFP